MNVQAKQDIEELAHIQQQQQQMHHYHHHPSTYPLTNSTAATNTNR